MMCHTAKATRLEAAGWVGVDLFFVLSGFLISGLLFSEYKKHQCIDFKRFLIRRALKIYPAFYVLIFVTFVYGKLFHQTAGRRLQYLSELFYVQNYGQVIWGHTWSLAVEEHFYILLPLFFLLLIRYSRDKSNPFHVIPRAFVILAATCLAIRIVTVRIIPPAHLQDWRWFRWAYAATHSRMDSLFFGVLLGYYHHFRPEVLAELFDSRWKKILSVILLALLLSPPLFFAVNSRIMLTVGYPILYVGFGILLLLCLRVRGVFSEGVSTKLGVIGTGLAYVGMYSYSVYLWHLPIETWGASFTDRVLHLHPGRLVWIFLYFAVSIAVGIFMSRIIEFPVLRIRDRVFPTMGAGVAKS